MRRIVLSLLALAALAGALYGSTHLLTGSSRLRAAISWVTPRVTRSSSDLGATMPGVDWRSVAFDVAGRMSR
jgi:hypothetical protein